MAGIGGVIAYRLAAAARSAIRMPAHAAFPDETIPRRPRHPPPHAPQPSPLAGGPDAKVLLARIGAPHGVRGEVRVRSFAADPSAFGGYGPLAAQDGRAFEIERLRPASDALIAKFRGVDDRGAAEALNGIDLYVDRSRLPAPEAEEFYHADLIGLAAVDGDGAPLGAVVAVHNFGAGDILEIAPERGTSLLVPFTKEAVPIVEPAAGRLVVIPPPGDGGRRGTARSRGARDMIIVAGTFRVPSERLEALRPHAAAVIAASRAEAGCRIYSFAEDLVEPGLIRVFEIWDTREHLDTHGRAAHMKPWRAALVECGASGRDIKTYASEAGEPL